MTVQSLPQQQLPDQGDPASQDVTGAEVLAAAGRVLQQQSPGGQGTTTDSSAYVPHPMEQAAQGAAPSPVVQNMTASKLSEIGATQQSTAGTADRLEAYKQAAEQQRAEKAAAPAAPAPAASGQQTPPQPPAA